MLLWIRVERYRNKQAKTFGSQVADSAVFSWIQPMDSTWAQVTLQRSRGKTSTAGMQTLCSVCLFWEEARCGLFVTIKCQFSPENKTVRIVCVDSRSSLTLKGRNAQSLSHCLRTESHKYYIKVLRIARPRRCWPMYCRKSDWAKSNTVNLVVRVCIYFIAVVC